MGAFLLTVIGCLVVGFSHASPVPGKENRIKYDQRQEGKWNVRADLENFIILVIPTSGSSSTPNVSLFDFLSKTIPMPYYKKSKKHGVRHHQNEEDGSIPDTEQFIESKTAPYHVDISRSRSHLAKLHPIPEGVKEEVIIARSPSVTLAKSGERASRAFLISVPMENGIKETRSKDDNARKTIGLSEETIENGLAEQFSDDKTKHFTPVGVFKAKIEKVNKQQEDLNKIEENNPNKMNDTLKVATLLAETIKRGLIESFKRINEKLLEQQRQEEEEEIIEEAKENLNKKEKAVEKSKKPLKADAPKGEFESLKISNKEVKKPEITLQPPKESSKEKPNEELLLLGAFGEQCGPGQERDSSGICVTIKS